MTLLPRIETCQHSSAEFKFLSFVEKTHIGCQVIYTIAGFAIVIISTLAIMGHFVGIRMSHSIIGISALMVAIRIINTIDHFLTAKCIPNIEKQRRLLATIVLLNEIAALTLAILSLSNTRFSYRTFGISLLILRLPIGWSFLAINKYLSTQEDAYKKNRKIEYVNNKLLPLQKEIFPNGIPRGMTIEVFEKAIKEFMTEWQKSDNEEKVYWIQRAVQAGFQQDADSQKNGLRFLFANYYDGTRLSPKAFAYWDKQFPHADNFIERLMLIDQKLLSLTAKERADAENHRSYGWDGFTLEPTFFMKYSIKMREESGHFH